MAADFQKILQEIQDNTGWSDYKITDWINRRHKNRLVEQPQIYTMRTGKLYRESPDYDPRYRLGQRILALRKHARKLAKACDETVVERSKANRRQTA